VTPPRRRPRPVRRRWPLVVLMLAAAAVIFLLGVGLGLTLEERPGPGGNVTSVRTLEPLPLPSETTEG
jgi:hypothetical protein